MKKIANRKVSPPLLPPCRVCGSKATGLHYGANTCEACKGFFSRGMVEHVNYICVGSGNCEVWSGRYRRKSCQYCRYQACLRVGMSKHAIKTGRYTQKKREADKSEVESLHEMKLTSSPASLDDSSCSVIGPSLVLDTMHGAPRIDERITNDEGGIRSDVALDGDVAKTRRKPQVYLDGFSNTNMCPISPLSNKTWVNSINSNSKNDNPNPVSCDNIDIESYDLEYCLDSKKALMSRGNDQLHRKGAIGKYNEDNGQNAPHDMTSNEDSIITAATSVLIGDVFQSPTQYSDAFYRDYESSERDGGRVALGCKTISMDAKRKIFREDLTEDENHYRESGHEEMSNHPSRQRYSADCIQLLGDKKTSLSQDKGETASLDNVRMTHFQESPPTQSGTCVVKQTPSNRCESMALSDMDSCPFTHVREVGQVSGINAIPDKSELSTVYKQPLKFSFIDEKDNNGKRILTTFPKKRDFYSDAGINSNHEVSHMGNFEEFQRYVCEPTLATSSVICRCDRNQNARKYSTIGTSDMSAANDPIVIYNDRINFVDSELQQFRAEACASFLKNNKFLEFIYDPAYRKYQEQIYEDNKLALRMFGSLRPIAVTEYQKIYNETGMDIDEREPKKLRAHMNFMWVLGMAQTFLVQLPGYLELAVHDQYLILKGSHMLLEAIFSYRGTHIEYELIPDFTGQCRSIDQPMCSFRDYDRSFLSAADKLQKLGASLEEDALMSAVCTFMIENYELENLAAVRRLLNISIRCLRQEHERTRGDNHERVFEECWRLLVELRELKTVYDRYLSVLKHEWPEMAKSPLVLAYT